MITNTARHTPTAIGTKSEVCTSNWQMLYSKQLLNYSSYFIHTTQLLYSHFADSVFLQIFEDIRKKKWFLRKLIVLKMKLTKNTLVFRELSRIEMGVCNEPYIAKSYCGTLAEAKNCFWTFVRFISAAAKLKHSVFIHLIYIVFFYK